MNHQQRRSLIASLLLTTALTAVGAGQVQAAAAPAEASTQVQEIVVTGSAVPTMPDAVAVPVSTINAVKIEHAGVETNALEILRKTLPAFEGRGNTGTSNANNTNQNTAGGSQARLRDLDTLVLIDGRRAAVDAVAGIGGKIFVDVNLIPPSAIERVEVLQDGASAIYGSDAVGGVVNFILKQKFDGLDIGGRVGGADGGYTERSGYFTAGKSFFNDRLDVVLSGSLSASDPLRQEQRAFTHPFYINGTNVPGAVGTNLLNANLNSPSQTNPTGAAATAPNITALIPGTYTASNAFGIGQSYDLGRFQYLLQKQDAAALTGSFTAHLSEEGHVAAFGEFQYAHDYSYTQFLPRVTAVTVPVDAPFNPTTGPVSAVQFGVPQDPKQYATTSDKFRATVGLRGEVNLLSREWKWETAYTHSQDDLEQKQRNVIYGPNVPLAIAGGFDVNGNPVVGGAYSKVYSDFSTTAPLVLVPALDPFARGGRNPASLTNLLGVEVINGSSRLDTVDGKVTTDLFTLPAGPAGMAVGGAWREEGLSAHADANGRNTNLPGATPTAQTWLGGQFFDPFAKSRTIVSAFGELRVPITSSSWNVPGFHAFDFIVAGRFEHYSDAGDSTVPKLGFRWQPVDPQLTIRGTYSKSFTAPSLYAEYGPTDTRQAGGSIIPGVFPGQPSSPFNAEDGNNPNLQPAKATNYSLSMVAKPNLIPHLTLTAQYTQVDLLGIAGGIGFNNILADVNRLGSASIFFNNVAMNNFPGKPGAVGFSAPGALLAYLNAAPGVNSLNIYTIDQFRNLGGIKLRTLDFSADYVIPTDNYGTFTLDTVGVYLDHYRYQALPSQPYFEFAGVASNSPQAGGTQPKWRLYNTFDWSYRAWDVVLGNTFIGAVKDEGPGGFTFAASKAAALPVKAYATFDAQVSYRIGDIMKVAKDAKIAVGVNNITNQMPPYAPNAFTDNRADVATYSPIGQLWYVTFDTRF